MLRFAQHDSEGLRMTTEVAGCEVLPWGRALRACLRPVSISLALFA